MTAPAIAGDHLYRMNYANFVAGHRAAGADITVAALPCGEKRASSFGLMKINDSGRIVEFAEKPKVHASLHGSRPHHLCVFVPVHAKALVGLCLGTGVPMRCGGVRSHKQD